MYDIVNVEPLAELAQKVYDDPKCNSCGKRCLTKEIVKKYENVKTSNGIKLANCVRNFCLHHNAQSPRCGDAECYEVFKEFMDALIKDYHKVQGEIHHGPANFGDLNNLPFGDLDPTGKFVVSTRVRVGRSVEGFPFTPCISKAKRLEMEKMVASSLSSLTGEHKGTYFPLDGMKEDVRKQLVEDHFLFKDDDSVLRDAYGYRDWPSGRGIFHNDSKTFLVWLNEEDHIRIISMEQGGNLARVYKRLIAGIQAIETKIKFIRNDKLGYMTCCPTNLGTTMRASVHVRVPKLSADMNKLNEVCNKYNLQARGFHGEHTDSPEGIYDISNRRRLGFTELDAATEMANGVKEIIKIEASL